MSAVLSALNINSQNKSKMTCNETLFDVITSIEAYSFHGESTIHTMSEYSKSIRKDTLGITLDDKIEIPMKPKSAKVSETENMGVYGESYEVSLSWQVQHLNEDTYKVLKRIKENYNHLIISDYSGSSLFVRCEEYGYNFSYIEKDGLIECELTINNRNGAQRIL